MIQTVRTLAWLWVASAAVGGTVGMAAAYRDPGPLRIEAFAAIYTAAGLSDRLMITLVLVVPLVGAVASAAFILVGRGTERASSIFAIGLVAVYFFVSGAALGLPGWLGMLMSSASLVTMTGFLVTFPSGTFRPRWAVAAPAVAATLVVIRPGLAQAIRVAMATPLESGDRVLAVAGSGMILLIAALSQVVRYRRMSSTTERYQARWVLAALVLMMVPPMVILVLDTAGLTGVPAIGYLVMVTALGSPALAVAVGVAAFRYHLYEIDRIISRTLTYAAVAVVVTGVYVAIVVGLPTLIGTTGEVYVAGGTLAAAAVFSPARRRMQSTIDRRFNRARYDSERELGHLSLGMSTVSDLDGVGSQTVGVIHRTVQPTSVAVWFAE